MIQPTQLEDLSNEIFFEIFDYLHALNIFTSFTSLNQRLTSILHTIPLRIVILPSHSRRQIALLSSYLQFHAHQVISLKISDHIFNYMSTISFLFRRHKFINLQLCLFTSILPSSKLNCVIEEVKSLDKLVSFAINQHPSIKLNDNVIHDLFEPMLLPKSPYLRSIVLGMPYNYGYISKYSSISSTLRSLQLHIFSSQSIPRLHSATSILRLCHSLQYLDLTLECEEQSTSDFSSLTNQVQDDDHILIASQLTTFNLKILAYGDHQLIPHMLRSMPNLKYFSFYLNRKIITEPYSHELLDGHMWKQMLDDHVPNLSKFEFFMIIRKPFPLLNFHDIIDSFIPLVGQYPHWQMIIDQWIMYKQHDVEYITLRTLNFHKVKSQIYEYRPIIVSDSFQTLSTGTTDHHEFYQDVTELAINLKQEKPIVICCSSLYQQVSEVIIEVPSRSTVWSSLCSIVNLNQSSDTDAQDTVTYLSQFVHLSTLTTIVFGSTFDVSRWKEIQFILQSCPNVTSLEMNTQLLLYSKFIDNPLLISIFQRIKKIDSKSTNTYFLPNYVSKLVDRFPSLGQIELRVYSLDICVSIIDVFLSHLPKLSYIKVYYTNDTLLNCPFSRDYVIQKRRERFPDQNLNEELINTGKSAEWVLIRLS